jgi:hypothetical protein
MSEQLAPVTPANEVALKLEDLALYDLLTSEQLAESVKDEKQFLEDINKMVSERNMFLQDNLKGLMLMGKVLSIIDFEKLPKNKLSAIGFLSSQIGNIFSAIEKDLPTILPVLNELKGKYANVLAEIQNAQEVQKAIKNV